MGFDVAKALVELQTKSLAQIETETAYTWGSRALAAAQLYAQSSNIVWLLLWQTFKDEAIEHAAFAEPGVLEEIRAALGT